MRQGAKTIEGLDVPQMQLGDGQPADRIGKSSDAAETEDVQAALKDGILSITLPKSPEARPRKITLQSS